MKDRLFCIIKTLFCIVKNAAGWHVRDTCSTSSTKADNSTTKNTTEQILHSLQQPDPLEGPTHFGLNSSAADKKLYKLYFILIIFQPSSLRLAQGSKGLWDIWVLVGNLGSYPGLERWFLSEEVVWSIQLDERPCELQQWCCRHFRVYSTLCE